jgi:hypothetical protein
MGRYAFFNTGFEYKFRFGIQSSEDIIQFGGSNTSIDSHHWDYSDIETIEEKLRNLEILAEIDHIDINSFSFSIDGTRDLYSTHFKGDSRNEEYFEYLLGCIILHQLHYTPNLECEFEW